MTNEQQCAMWRNRRVDLSSARWQREQIEQFGDRDFDESFGKLDEAADPLSAVSAVITQAAVKMRGQQYLFNQ